MDPLLPGETDVMEREADKDLKRKIQFSVPSSVPIQLDPRQVEMVSALCSLRGWQCLAVMCVDRGVQTGVISKVFSINNSFPVVFV